MSMISSTEDIHPCFCIFAPVCRMRGCIIALTFCLGCLSAACGEESARNQVAVLSDVAAGIDQAVVETISEALLKEDFAVTRLSVAEVCDPAVLTPERFFLYVLPNPSAYPAAGTNALAAFLGASGNLLVVGRPDFPGDPLIETVSPRHKQYPMQDIRELRGTGDPLGRDVGTVRLDSGGQTFSCYARPEGKGFERGYRMRWIPLLRAYDSEGIERGTAAWMLVHMNPLDEGPAFRDALRRLIGTNRTAEPLSAEGGVSAVCTVTNAAALKQIAESGLFGGMARRIARGVHLRRSGTEWFSYWPDEKVRLGGEAVNYGTQDDAVTVRVRVSVKGSSESLFEESSVLALKTGATASVDYIWPEGVAAGDCYEVRTELLESGEVIDAVTHEVGGLDDDEAGTDAFVRVQGSNFMVEGRRWYPVGVNYWPRYAIALEQEDYVYHWLTPGFYNPEEVEKDLALLQGIGANFVAIRAHHENDRRTLLDFLRRCRGRGIRAMVYLSTHEVTDEPLYFQGIMTPFAFRKDLVEDFLKATRIVGNPSVMAWDLIWEPSWWAFSDGMRSFGWEKPDFRARWDEDWRLWIVERYGSLDAAERDWGVVAPRTEEGAVTSPGGRKLVEDGPWCVMVSAYRRFMADLMNRHWNNATRELRRMDPAHLISYRQGNLPPIDFTLTSTFKHVDFFSMEGYHFKPHILTNVADVVGFVNRYLPFAMRGKPFMWLEYGHTAWDAKAGGVSGEGLTYQFTCVDLINRMAYDNGANGLAPWWMAGGYRVSEKSDFGMFNPDGTLRPSGKSLKRYAGLYREKPPHVPKTDEFFVLDTDAHSGGLPHIARNAGAHAFARAAAVGRTLGIKTAATGSTSADVPLLAVGNTPYNGSNPPKFLNAEFNWFRIRAGDGGWINVTNGITVCVPRGVPVSASASAGNLQEAMWLAPSDADASDNNGRVYLASTDRSQVNVKEPILHDTPYLADAVFAGTFSLAEKIEAQSVVELVMTAEGRAQFGEVMRFVLKPQDE
ncbi:MAG: hypothetical protein R6V06_03205 [Kiritimatiellia bacterium]